MRLYRLSSRNIKVTSENGPSWTNFKSGDFFLFISTFFNLYKIYILTVFCFSLATIQSIASITDFWTDYWRFCRIKLRPPKWRLRNDGNTGCNNHWHARICSGPVSLAFKHSPEYTSLFYLRWVSVNQSSWIIVGSYSVSNNSNRKENNQTNSFLPFLTK